jgi:uncharacterized protein
MKKIFKRIFIGCLVLFVLLNIVVLFHAYKFTHIYEIGEVEVKKQEDKTGWDITKEMLFGINMPKQKEVTPDTTYKTVYLTDAENLKLEAWHNQVPNAKGTVAMFHGHGSQKGAILKEASEFEKMGYSTFLLDLRAHGKSQGNTCTIGYEEGEDIKLAFDYLKNSGEKNIILYGISLGASTITKGMNDYPLTPSKIILEMPYGTLAEAVSGRVKMMGVPAEPLSTLLTFWGGTIHGFWAYDMKPAEFAKKLKCPVLIQKGKLDNRVTDKEVNDILNNISTDKKLVIYDISGHQSLCTNENTKWVSEVSAFLAK